MSAFFELVGTLLTYLVGGTAGSGSDAVTITFAQSWVGRIANTIIADANASTGTGVIAIFFVFSLLMAGFKLVHSLKRI